MTDVDRNDLLIEIADRVLRVGREVEPHGPRGVVGAVELSGTEASVMRWIDRNPGTTPAEAADATVLKRSNLSAALRSLEAKGMIERRPDPDDARSVRLYGTPIADDSIAKVRAFWVQMLGGALDQTPPAGTQPIDMDDLRVTFRVLDLLAERLRTGH
ncbi:MarR family transcriptional regulator [Gordonia desulfuricans]|uniref:MarR family transcriptional regulator n=1 Tax=Gordonia desulfuricans TaxID=89051 RepID=A0A7K3LIL7_9ACTN|nr:MULTISPECIES: helix-turn-helix domain-containing protein [Gordonia]EMP13967.1 MarR family transcriptional regulator [Gordonia sp. NB41Y]NDK88013.1 MarR family transcriptional regulator [Gordonia desulfuricans]WLP90000.1 helix-turn-helix domain-containing protein [Gordonia sp. NB41Y]